MNLLEKLNASAYSYYNVALPTFLEICQPLFDLGIESFSYLKLFPDGSYLRLEKNQEFMQKYFSTIAAQGDSPTIQIELSPLYQSHHFRVFSDLSRYDKKRDPLVYLAHAHNLWHRHTIYKNMESFIEGYTFSLSRSYEHADQFYLKYMPLLERFCLYFQERASHLIDTTDKKKLAYFEQQFQLQKHSLEDLEYEKIGRFLAATPLKHIPIKGKFSTIYLAKREAECLSYLSLGKTCKEIGRILDLAPRTVESYLNSAKEKSGYETRTELLTHFVRHAPSLYFDSYVNQQIERTAKKA